MDKSVYVYHHSALQNNVLDLGELSTAPISHGRRMSSAAAVQPSFTTISLLKVFFNFSEGFLQPTFLCMFSSIFAAVKTFYWFPPKKNTAQKLADKAVCIAVIFFFEITATLQSTSSHATSVVIWGWTGRKIWARWGRWAPLTWPATYTFLATLLLIFLSDPSPIIVWYPFQQLFMV